MARGIAASLRSLLSFLAPRDCDMSKRKFIQDSSGATSIEYGLICALIFLVILAAAQAMGASTARLYELAMAIVRA